MTNNEINFAATYIASIAKEDNAVEKVNIAIQSLLTTYEKENKVPRLKTKISPPLHQLLNLHKRRYLKWIKILKIRLF